MRCLLLGTMFLIIIIFETYMYAVFCCSSNGCLINRVEIELAGVAAVVCSAGGGLRISHLGRQFCGNLPVSPTFELSMPATCCPLSLVEGVSEGGDGQNVYSRTRDTS